MAQSPADAWILQLHLEFEAAHTHHSDMRPSDNVWTYVEKLPVAAAGGNPRGKCRFCCHEKTINAGWWWVHLESCDGEAGDPEQKAAAKRGAAEALAKQSAKKARKDDQQRVQQQLVQAGGLPAAFRTDLKKQADLAVGRFLFANGLPLRLSDDRFYKAMLAAVQKAGPSYTSPSRQRVTEQLLPDIERECDAAQEQLISKDKDRYGLMITTDGWTDCNGVPWINVCLVSPGGDHFVAAIDSSGNKKSMSYIASKLSPYIERYPEVDYVVVDGACKGVIPILQRDFKQMSGSVCSTHSLDLLLEDICELEFMQPVLKNSKAIIDYINHHHMTKALFKQISSLVLLRPSGTRFGSYTILLERLLECRESLEVLLLKREYKGWVASQDRDLKDKARYVLRLRYDCWLMCQHVVVYICSAHACMNAFPAAFSLVAPMFTIIIHADQWASSYVMMMMLRTIRHPSGLKLSLQ